MYDALQKEIATYEKRTPKSARRTKRALGTDSAWCGEQLQTLRAISNFCEGRKGRANSRSVLMETNMWITTFALAR